MDGHAHHERRAPLLRSPVVVQTLVCSALPNTICYSDCNIRDVILVNTTVWTLNIYMVVRQIEPSPKIHHILAEVLLLQPVLVRPSPGQRTRLGMEVPPLASSASNSRSLACSAVRSAQRLNFAVPPLAWLVASDWRQLITAGRLSCIRLSDGRLRWVRRV